MNKNIELDEKNKKRLEFFYIFGLLHLGFIIISMTFTTRIVTLSFFDNFKIIITGGMFIVPFIFFIQDIITEVYGYYNARKVLFNSLFLFMLYGAIFFTITSIIQKNSKNSINDFQIISNTLPRQILSFTVSLAIGGTINNYILTKLKIFFHSRFLAMRFISATAIGEFFFQIIAVLIAWQGIFSITDILPIAILSYTYKILFEMISMPINIYICNHLKNIK